MRVQVDISEESLDGEYGQVSGLCVTCKRCGHSVDVFGTETGSVLRGAAMLREECPNGENNYYDTGDW